jgi:hypothetical protein
VGDLRKIPACSPVESKIFFSAINEIVEKSIFRQLKYEKNTYPCVIN